MKLFYYFSKIPSKNLSSISNAMIASVKLPSHKNAIIKRKKLGYLISLTDPVGKLKAGFFRPIGFNETNTAKLKQQLLKIVLTNEVKNFRLSGDKSGINYEVRGILSAPNGKKYPIRTFWFIKNRSEKPSFITAYPV